MNAYEVNQTLGREFLTWLWWRTEETGGEFDLDGPGTVALVVDDEVVLIDDAGEATDILRAGEPSISDEAGAALRSGKKATQLKLCLVQDQDQWLFTLNERLHLRGARLPPSDAEHPEDIFNDQMDGVDTLLEVIDALYHEYLQLRLAPKWKTTVASLREWVAGKGER